MVFVHKDVKNPRVLAVSFNHKEIQFFKEFVFPAIQFDSLGVAGCELSHPEDFDHLVSNLLQGEEYKSVLVLLLLGSLSEAFPSTPFEWHGRLWIPCCSSEEFENNGSKTLMLLEEAKKYLRLKEKPSQNYLFLQKDTEILDFLKEAPHLTDLWSLDIESTPVPPYHKDFRLISIAFAFAPGKAVGFGLIHPQATLRFWRRKYRIWEALREFLANRSIRWIGHNILKFDKPGLECTLKFSMVDGYQDFWNRFEDTMIMKYTLDESAKGSYNLESCAVSELHWDKWKIDIGDLDSLPLDQVVHYNCQDADASFQLYFSFRETMIRSSSHYGVDLWNLYRNIHLPNAINAACLDQTGVLCNVEYALKKKEEWENEISSLTRWLREQPSVQELECRKIQEYLRQRKKVPAKGTPEWEEFQNRVLQACAFNPTGTNDLRVLLFEILKRPYPSQYGLTPKTGQPRISTDVLQYLADHSNCEISRALLRIFKLSDNLSDYVYPVLRNRESTRDGLSHPSFYPPGTETGRFSCRNADSNSSRVGVGENLQKIAKDPEIKNLYCSRFP